MTFLKMELDCLDNSLSDNDLTQNGVRLFK